MEMTDDFEKSWEEVANVYFEMLTEDSLEGLNRGRKRQGLSVSQMKFGILETGVENVN
jgi:hypothetical protein